MGRQPFSFLVFFLQEVFELIEKLFGLKEVFMGLSQHQHAADNIDGSVTIRIGPGVRRNGGLD